MTPEQHADNIANWTNPGLRQAVIDEIAAAVAEEREECAKVAGSNKSHTEHGELGECCDTAEEIAAAIRARK